MSLRTKVLLLVLTSTTLVVALTILYFSINIRKNNIAEAKKLADSETAKYSSEIKNVFDKALECTNALSSAFVKSKNIKSSARDSINKEILFDLLKNNEDYLSLWLVWELRAFDPSYNKKHGRIRNVAYKINNEISFVHKIADTTNNELKSLYYEVKQNNKQTVGEPYYGRTMKDVLMVSPITPLRFNNQFIGVIGIDLSLDKIQQLVQKINDIVYLMLGL